MEQTGSIYAVAPCASLTITCCSVLQACFPRTNVLLIYNATKDKAGFLILISDSVIIPSIKNIMSLRLFFHVLFWFGTEKAQTSVSKPWITSFIFSLTKPGDRLENTSVALKDFWTPDWTLRTGLAAAHNQCTATGSVTIYQVIASCEMITRRRRLAALPARIVTRCSPGIAIARPAERAANRHAAGKPVSKTPGQCISILQTLARCAPVGWKMLTEM